MTETGRVGRACHWQRGMPQRQPPVASQELRSDGDKEGGPGVPSATGHPIGGSRLSLHRSYGETETRRVGRALPSATGHPIAAAACRFTGVTEKRRQGGWAGRAIATGHPRRQPPSLHRSYGVTETRRVGRACHRQRGILGQPPVASQELRSDGDKEGGPGVPSATGHPIGAAACRFTGVTEKRRQGGWAGRWPSATGHPIGAAACRFTGVTE